MSVPAPARATRQGVAFLLLGVVLGGMLIGLRYELYTAQSGMAALAALLPVSYAFAAGMVATVNPCGVLLLPSLVAFHLGRGTERRNGARERAKQSLLLGGMATLGFVTLFAFVGSVIGAGGTALADAFPSGGILIGAGLTGLGARLALSGQGFGILRANRVMGRVRLGDGPRSLFLFGVAYAVTSLSCTLPIFLVVVSGALASGSAIGAVFQFVSYSLGMGSVLLVVVLAAAFFEQAVARILRRIVPHVHRLSAAFLLGTGLFLLHYWLTASGWLLT